ncbi:PspA/IM30 family protein [Rhodococcus sp. NPDC060090]|uniref:PspA/IM30 family protein n=1 Tax=Rhodococcus sp. NPDC060090 TaxID=3347056 RepID=UPI00364BAB61
MSTNEASPERIPDPDNPEEPVPDVTPAGPDTPSVPDVPPGPSIPDVPPVEPEPSPDPDITPAGTRAPTIEEITGYTEGGVPTFDSVRDKIERRSGVAIGMEELAHESAAGRTLDEQYEDRKKAAVDKLDEIRRSMKST